MSPGDIDLRLEEAIRNARESDDVAIRTKVALEVIQEKVLHQEKRIEELEKHI